MRCGDEGVGSRLAVAEDAISGQFSIAVRQAPPGLVGQEREQVFMREEFAMVLGGPARRAPPKELRR